MVRKAITALSLALALAACVTTKANMLDSRTAIVSGRGSAFTEMASVQTRMIREAAQQTLTHGYTHFMILGASDQTQSAQWRTPTAVHTSGMVSSSCIGNSCSGIYSGTSSITGGEIYNFVKPGADMTIRFFRADEIAGLQVWDAADVLAVANGGGSAPAAITAPTALAAPLPDTQAAASARHPVATPTTAASPSATDPPNQKGKFGNRRVRCSTCQ